MSTPPLTLHLPGLLQAQIMAAREVGLYEDEMDLIHDAVQMLLLARPDVRLKTAAQLYRRGDVSLGKAAELAGMDIVSFKRALAEMSIARTAPEPLAEITAMAQTALQIANRAVLNC